MNKNFKKAKHRLEKSEVELASLKERMQKAHVDLDQFTQRLNELGEELGRLQVKNVSEEEIKKVESERHEISTEIDRVSALIPALEIGIRDVEAQVLKDRESKNEVTAGLLANWYAMEVKNYDVNAAKLTKSILKLLTAYQIADSIGRRDVVKSALGPAFQYIGKSKFPKISGFSFVDFTTAKGKFSPGQDFINEIFDEIIQINGGK